MRLTLIALALVAGLSAISGCSSTGDTAAAMQMMNNPPNSCGPGGTADIEDCESGR